MFATFIFAEQSTTQHGTKYCTPSTNGAKVLVQPTIEAVVCPFGPGNSEKDLAATRQDFRTALQRRNDSILRLS